MSQLGLADEIRGLARQRDALILAHNYQRPEVQDIADFVGDSLGLSRQAANTTKPLLVFCGVHFMAETAAILSPRKRVLLPDLGAGCSLADTVSGAQVLVHPECGCAGSLIESMGSGEMRSEGVHVASTEQMIQLATRRPSSTFVVATEIGMLHRLRQAAPEKEFVPADAEATCSFMKTITLEKVRDALALDQHAVVVPEEIAVQARAALERMVTLG